MVTPGLGESPVPNMLPPLETWAERPLTSGELMRPLIAQADATLTLSLTSIWFVTPYCMQPLSVIKPSAGNGRLGHRLNQQRRLRLGTLSIQIWQWGA